MDCDGAWVAGVCGRPIFSSGRLPADADDDIALSILG